MRWLTAIPVYNEVSHLQSVLCEVRRYSPDVLVVGAGVIGLSLALELRWRGMSVSVAERGVPMAGASSAAAGMLAAEDPHNPVDLRAISRFSAALYPRFLARICELSGLPIPFQTDAQGAVTVRFRLPTQIERGQASLSVLFHFSMYRFTSFANPLGMTSSHSP